MAAASLSPGMARGSPPDEPAEAAKPAAPQSQPIHIFLNAPGDLESLWRMLDQPDFVLQKGAERRKRSDTSTAAEAKPGSWPAIIQSLAIGGEIDSERARISIDFAITATTKAPTWVSLRLEKQKSVTDAREGDRVLPLRVAQDGGWQVELQGEGEHHVRVDLRVPVRSTSAGRSLSIAIPEAASTRLDVTVDQAVSEASLGPDEAVGLEPVRGGKGTRLSS